MFTWIFNCNKLNPYITQLKLDTMVFGIFLSKNPKNAFLPPVSKF
jgi:TRAP-type mannitol/chloroaromatic compound transport system permease large subunit